MRLVVLALSLPYPHPSPDMEPDASNTIMASSVQTGGFRSSAWEPRLQIKRIAKVMVADRVARRRALYESRKHFEPV